MRMCVQDLGGSGNRHDPLSVGFVVIGGQYIFIVLSLVQNLVIPLLIN